MKYLELPVQLKDGTKTAAWVPFDIIAAVVAWTDYGALHLKNGNFMVSLATPKQILDAINPEIIKVGPNV